MENKTSKYFKYAIGEIILVVIGILIALQINNWNTERKEQADLNNYLQNIVANLESDKLQIEEMLSFRDSTKLYSQKIIKASQNKSISTADFLLLTHEKYNVFYDVYLEINPSGFEALKNSGFIAKIQGAKIEKLINDYYLIANSIAKQEKSLNDFIENMEVLGFEQNIFPKLINVLNRPDFENYFATHQKEILAIMNHPSILGANFRGSIPGSLMLSYEKLLKLGVEINKEIALKNNGKIL
jgi:hypothetical protein